MKRLLCWILGHEWSRFTVPLQGVLVMDRKRCARWLREEWVFHT